MEQFRKDFFQTHIIQKNDFLETKESNLIDTGDVSIRELCSDDDRSDAELEMDYFSHLKNIFTSGKQGSNGSPGLTCVKPVVSIGGTKYRGKRIKK